jgi:hypothetical protein
MQHKTLATGTIAIALLCGATSPRAAAPAAPFPVADYGAGGHTLSFDGNGIFRLLNDADHAVLVEGSYAIAGGEIRLTDRSGPYACTGEKARATYRWSVSGGALVLAKIADPCDERSGDLTAAHWMRK